ncbi:MAG: mannose-1-phosphate guanylyltransferase/mannose-6-phosphate isomerase [Gammaproteobacteria bacterium]|nr:mannose-1-phosphate guanylyltransferase/mannose-6-phosphate isomerase [Gammaproteobacteria bacterium]
MTSVAPIVVAGGSGTRLWPFSREHYPKQFLAIGDAHSFLQRTLLRLRTAPAGLEFEPPVVVGNEEHRFLIRDQAAKIGFPLQSIVLEPEGRNTAPALAAAALTLEGDPVFAMFPADQQIDNPGSFMTCLRLACEEAARGCIVTLGVVPVRAETGYGYIHVRGDARTAGAGPIALPTDGFVEKPDAARAEEYLRCGEYLWNSGVFVMRNSVWQRALQRYRPDVHAACAAAVAGGARDGEFFRLERDRFTACPAISIDYAVMQPAIGDASFECRVVPFSAGWSDAGSWYALWENGKRDREGNILGGDVIARDTRNSMVLAQDRLVVALGCEDLVIAETADAVLVASLGSSQALSGLVRDLKIDNRHETVTHRRVYRPWGSYEPVAVGRHYQVKRLTLDPGKRLSLQLHHRRAEHWVVVRGVATVIRGDETIRLAENESIYIPRETRHRLANDAVDPLEVIEVQTGDYLGEDDIVRFDDDFGRAVPKDP